MAVLEPVDPPPFTMIEPYGLLSAATIIEGVTGAALGGVVYPYRCDPVTDTWPGPCTDTPDPPGTIKSVPGGVDLITGYPFAVYAFETCPIVAYTEAQLEARARESLLRTEQHQVERALWLGRGDSVGLTQRTDVEILSTVPLDIVAAVALAEYWLGLRDGVGMLHINPIAAAYAHDHDLATTTGAVQYSPMGHRWVFGGGYVPGVGPVGAPADLPANTAWMFVTRHVTLRRSTIRVDSGFRAASNEHDSRAERVYVPTVPCSIAAIPVATITGPDGAPIPIPTPTMTLDVVPDTGPVPLTVTATTTGETGAVTWDWGDA